MILNADALIVAGEHPARPLPGKPLLSLPTVEDPALWPWLESTVRFAQVSLGLVVTGPETDAERRIVARIHAHYLQCGVASRTLEKFCADWAVNFARALKRNPLWAMHLGRPFEGQTVFVCGSGHSLDDVGHLLPEAASKGPIVCTNTGARALQHYGVQPDVVFCAEALHLAGHFEGVAAPVVFDVLASPKNWGAVERPIAVCRPEPNLLDYLVSVPVAPTNYACSALCGAVSQSFSWGASRVVLLGADFCYLGPQAYANGSPFDDVRQRVELPYLFQHGASKGGEQSPVPVHQRRGIGGGTVFSALPFAPEIEWLQRCGKATKLINANRRGVDLLNAPNASLESLLCVMEPMGVRPTIGVDSQPADARHVVDRIVRECEEYLSNPVPVPRSPLLHLAIAPVLLQQSQCRTEKERADSLTIAACNSATSILESIAFA